MTARNAAQIWIGGEAGDGIASAGDIWLKAVSRLGMGVFAHNSYQSVIRGGHVLLQICTGPFPVLSQGDGWDFLIALDQKTLDLHTGSAREGGFALFNTGRVTPPAAGAAPAMCGIPVDELTGDLPKNPVMQNTVLLGALAFLLRLPWAGFEDALRSQFGKRKAELADANATAARRGWDFAEKNFAPAAHIALAGDGQRRMVMSGNQAIALGALAGGCKFYAAYPMTPASSIMHWLAPRAPKFGMLMKQTEDEIAAINMAIGAGYAGLRAMVGTSGGGFALMTEAFGMAGMVEAPVVVALVQRGGPSTGLPTKTEQGDLFQALGASQGEFPRAIIAPLDLVDAYYSTIEALNLAEQFQMPVIVLSDLYLSERNATVAPDSLNHRMPIERGEIASTAEEGRYQRYADTPSGVSPRTFPGTPGGMHTATTDEHDPQSVLVSDVFTNPAMRVRMVEKRMRKMDGVARATAARAILREGPEREDLTIVGWGSTYQVLHEARTLLEAEGFAVNLIQFRVLWPFPAEQAQAMLTAAGKTVCVENNFGGQLARLIRQETGIAFPLAIRKFDGEPFSPGPLAAALKRCFSKDAPAVQKLVSAELNIPMVLK
jgi:2-oxoglutarate ferredoxin oxidoreductase subunit alpha